MKSNTLYLQCESGISGDMLVAALIDAGADIEKIEKAFEKSGLSGFEIKTGRVKKSGIDCMDFSVILQEDNHDHDMDYLHGHVHEQGHEYTHDDVRSRHHSHENGPDYAHEHDHVHRGLKEVLEIIDRCDITDNACRIAYRIFDIIAEAEAKAHGTDKDHVHFHEVGAVDSIVDIVAIAVSVDDLGVDEVIITRICEGCGTIRCQHGILPVPVPAVAAISAEYGLPMHFMGIDGEFVTPTGAAACAALMTSDKLPDSFSIKKTGIGAGKREYEIPSMVRAMLIEPSDRKSDTIYKLESNIDDCSGEAMGYVMKKLFEAGARDVHFMPVYMKKNRPAWQINVICDREKIEDLEDIIFDNTTTIGIRRMEMERTVLDRKVEEYETSFGKIRIKENHRKDKVRRIPEYDDIALAAEKTGLSYIDVYNEVLKELADK